MSQWFHVTARLPREAPSLVSEVIACWLWAHAREAFPEAIAAVLMPSHPHLVVATTDVEEVKRRLGRLLGQLRRRFGIGAPLGRDVSASVILAGDKLERQVRYVLLNPCRDRLVRCPLAWPWTTHRDVVGAIVDPWVTAPRLATALGFPARDFVARHHAYVSGDPSAQVEGTALPVVASSTRMPTYGLRAIADATIAATRLPFPAIRQRGLARNLFVSLAYDQGWDHPTKLAEVCGCEARAIRRLATSVDGPALAAARLCLGDVRLRKAVTAPAPLTARGSNRVRRSFEPSA